MHTQCTHAHHSDRSVAAAIFANGTYFVDMCRIYDDNQPLSCCILCFGLFSLAVLALCLLGKSDCQKNLCFKWEQKWGEISYMFLVVG
jgi:hypothetical protein